MTNVLEAVLSQTGGGKRVTPIVRVTGDQRWQVLRLAEKPMREQVIDLPVSFPLGQTKMPVHQVERSLGRFNDHENGASRLFLLHSHRDPMMGAERPAREDQIAVASSHGVDVLLKESTLRAKIAGQETRLLVVMAPGCVVGDLLEADQVGILPFDHLDNPIEMVSTVSATDPFMDVVGQKSHRA